MPCHAPKYPYPSSHDNLCATPTIRQATATAAGDLECLECTEQKRKAAAAKAAEAAVANKPNGVKKENVKSNGVKKENVKF